MSAAILIRPDGFSAVQLDRLVQQARLLGFPLLHVPGRGSHPLFQALAESTGDEREKVLDAQYYRLDAITDDSPFFFRFYYWSELLKDPLTPSHTTALGQLVLLLLLGMLTLLGALLIVAPLLVFRRRGLSGGGSATLGILGYFLALGLGLNPQTTDRFRQGTQHWIMVRFADGQVLDLQDIQLERRQIIRTEDVPCAIDATMDPSSDAG